MNESYEELLKNTYGYKLLELDYALCNFKYDIIAGIPLPKKIKASLLRHQILNLCEIGKAMKDYLK